VISIVGVVGNPSKSGIGEAVRNVHEWCAKRGLTLVGDELLKDLVGPDVRSVPTPELVGSAELIFAFGGDGTLLFAVREVAAAGRGTPIIGVNMGSLGFLTQIAEDEFPEVLQRLDPERLPVSERMMLSVSVAGGQDERLALNDVVISKGADSRMLSFEARVDGELVTRYAADGLVLATPTGSTAHSLSAGGPVVMPNVEAIIATPICPHTLSMRSCVVPPTAVIEVEMLSCDERTLVTTDGHKVFHVAPGDVVTVRMSEARARLVDVAEHSYYEILGKKMRWAGRVRER
jgi:NAD+ kinase